MINSFIIIAIVLKQISILAAVGKMVEFYYNAINSNYYSKACENILHCSYSVNGGLQGNI